MQKEVLLKNCGHEEQELQAKILPEQGMNLCSFQGGLVEVIEPATENLFQERYAGLGALIGPHFHHRKPEIINLDFDTTLFPHIRRVQKKGIKEPFSHGIARYAPWKYQSSITQIQSRLTGKDTWKGLPLRQLEGQDFEMHLSMILMHYGLRIRYEVESEGPSVLGFHYYFSLPDSDGVVIAEVKPEYRYKDRWQQIPAKWLSPDKRHLFFPAHLEADFGFRPSSEEEHRIILRTKTYELHLIYLSATEEHSFQIYRPREANYICIEPLSAIDPKNPVHNRNLIELKLEIFHY